MIFTEEKRHIFSVPDEGEYYFVQYISNDFAKITGIADFNSDKFNLTFVPEIRNTEIDLDGSINCILVDNKVFNLIIKRNHDRNTTYETLRNCFMEMKTILLNERFTDMIDKYKIAIPKIDDGLDWEKVKELIQDIFKDTNVEILACDSNEYEVL